MAEKTFNNVRFQFLYDTYDSWKTKNPTLKAGEIAIATIPSGGTPQENNTVTTPQVLIKVGDGSTPYNTLPFISGRAADVYSWAKAATKPSYTANEITNLGTFIGEYLADQDIVTDTDTQYRIVQDTTDQNKFTLQSKAKGTADSTFATVSTITIPKYDDSALLTRLTNVEGVASAANTKAEALVSGATPAKKAEQDADGNVITATYATKEDLNTTNENVSANADAIKTLNGNETTEGSVLKTVKDGINAWANNVGDSTIDSFKEVVDYIAKHGGDFNELVGEVSTLSGEIDNIINGITTVESANNAQYALTASTANDATNDADGRNISTTYATKTELGEVEDDVEANAAEITNIKNGTTTVPNATTATNAAKAEKDASGNVITTTYAKNADLAAIAKTGNVNDLVQTTGDVIIFKCGNAASISNS